MAAKLVKTQDPRGVVANVASEEALMLLRRLVKILESNQTADAGGRQRVTVDAMTTGLTLSTIGVISTVGNMNNLFNWDHRQLIDTARIAYNTGIRAKLA